MYSAADTRESLIKLASILPPNSPDRKTILANLTRTAAPTKFWITGNHFGVETYTKIFASIDKQVVVPTGKYHPQHAYPIEDLVYTGKVYLRIKSDDILLGKYKYTIDGTTKLGSVESPTPAIVTLFESAQVYSHWDELWPYRM